MCLVQRVDEFAEDHNNETFLRSVWFRVDEFAEDHNNKTFLRSAQFKELMNFLRIIIMKHFSEVSGLES